jgi:hypothetical protein
MRLKKRLNTSPAQYENKSGLTGLAYLQIFAPSAGSSPKAACRCSAGKKIK